MTTQAFIQEYRDYDVAQLALRIRQFPEVDAAFALQQIDGYQRAKSKLPSLAERADWHWPARLSVEQCSSEQTAQYKADLLQVKRESSARSGADLTGGLGIDTLWLSQGFETWHYVEMQEALTTLAEHNFRACGRENICIHHTDAEAFLKENEAHFDILFLDPARRDKNGGKVFRLSDCTPDICTLYDTLIARCDLLLLKLSPMLDISEALSHLPDAREVHVVAVGGEMKEILVAAERKEQPEPLRITAVNLLREGKRETFTYSLEEETQAEAALMNQLPTEHFYLYEPNSTILKAGAFKLVAKRYGLQKLAANTHLYASKEKKDSFPGRVFEVHEAEKEELKTLKQANVLCRNYPLKPEDLKKKLKVKDGGETYVIGCRVAQKPVVLAGVKVSD